ncbi:Dymeclin, putative [Pediculus humanus corporis]|uniref:Dymeclin n=1 Tax=Pediculus humanus subsp. corporis TaxID=121224 RepID=E0VAE1_PEDHC|nr:Dymeclin, putative [Pediculus humanus corporis]EEB10347.1 Dymeclin, putative [Pediculus humanus corporis]
MGASNSKDLSSNEYLLKFSGKDHISCSDQFWNVFLSFSFKPPSSKSENEVINDKLSKIFENLLKNNLESGNFVSLIRVFINKSTDVLSASSTGNEILVWQTYNALFIIRCFTRYLVETVKEAEYIRHFNVKPMMVSQTVAEQQLDNLSNKKIHENPLESLLESLLEILIDVPLDFQTYSLHLEVVNCLLVFLSAQMYTRKPAAKLIIFKTLMQGRPSIHSPLLIKTLLGHFIKQEKPYERGGGSIVIGLASNIWHILSLAYKNSTNLEPPKGITLANQSLLLILVLVSHCTAEKNLLNPYRDFLFTFIHNSPGHLSLGSNPEEIPVSSVSALQINFDHLYVALCNTAANECSTLMLYLLLHRNENVKNFILARADLEYLVVPILKTLYNITESNSHHIYMSLIILLILSEDGGFGQTVHQITIKNVTWYHEKVLTEISLGGLLLLVVIRTIHYNMLKMRDKYLHTNCLAALANMSNNFCNLNSYVSQRLLSLFETLAKKYHRLEITLKTNMVKINSETRENDDGEKENSFVEMGKNSTTSQSKPNEENSVKETIINGTHESDKEDMAIQIKSSTDLDVKNLSGDEAVINVDDNASSDIVQDLNVLEEVLRMILEIINSCLSNQIQHNPNLVYALLYKKDIFDPFRTHQNFNDVIQNLDSVINYFSDKLKQVQTDLSVNEVLSTITQGTLVWPSHKLKKFPELKFKYVEEDQPENFFIPYVWNLTTQFSGINWSSNNKKIFFLDSEG